MEAAVRSDEGREARKEEGRAVSDEGKLIEKTTTRL